MKKFKEFSTWVTEKDEHKKSCTYKKLTPKMKKAVDDVFSTMEKSTGDFLSTFDKNVEIVAKKHGVKVKDIMIPRSSMVIIKKNSSLDDILPLIIDSSHSRFPVILENKDEIVGILLAKDLLKYLAKKNGSFDIEKVIRPSVIINCKKVTLDNLNCFFLKSAE